MNPIKSIIRIGRLFDGRNFVLWSKKLFGDLIETFFDLKDLSIM